MRFRVKWVVALIAVLLNLGTGPMAWADLPAPATENCHDAAQSPNPSAPDPMPCCDDGGCHCVAPALSVPIPAVTTRLSLQRIRGAIDTSALPANPLDDSLRPPIR